MVRYREIRPSEPLRPFVSSLWVLELDGADRTPQRVVPDGHAELIVNWEHPFEAFEAGSWQRQPGIFLAGQIAGPLLLRPNGRARMMGIGFHPHGAASLLATPMQETSGRFTPIEDLSLTLSRDLRRAAESADPVAAIEGALLGAAGRARQPDPLIAEAIRQFSAERAPDLAVLAKNLGLSTRQLERRFNATVGLPPKLFGRIQRFSRVFRVLDQPFRNWAETAIACGYYDQAHLIRDCRDFSGATPAVLLAGDGDLARHFYERYSVSRLYNTGSPSAI